MRPRSRVICALLLLVAGLSASAAVNTNPFISALFDTLVGIQSQPPPPVPAGRVYPPGTSGSCQPEQLVCQNGYFNNSKCLEWEQWNWPDSYDNCTCDPGWYGTDCSIATKAVCDNMTIPNVTNYILDTSFVNLNSTTKHLECFVNDPGITQFLADHRVNVTVKDGGKSMNFTMYTRVWNESRSKHIYSFSPQVTIMNCWGSKCQSYRSNDPKAQAVYECEDITCTSCDPDQGCSLLFVLSVSQIHGFTANFYNIDDNQGTADCKFIADTQLSFTLTCRTGACTDLTPSSNYVPYHSNYWIIILILTMTAVSAATLILLAIRANVSNRPQFKLDISRRALGESPYQPLMEGDIGPVEPVEEADKVRKANIQLVFDHVNYDIEVSAAPASEVVPLGADPARAQQPVSGLALYWQGMRSCWHAMGLDRMCCGPTRKRRVLNEVTGLVRSGEILAILGLSGAGKTTLLDILARRPKIGRVSGTVTLFRDGTPVKPRRTRLADFASYVPSDDCLLPTMTVFETVLFSARLRLGRSWSDERIFEKVERVLADLGLTHVADSRVGSYDHGGISTGERKRVCIAMELVADPLVLLLDEPTSGLDSYNASLLMEVISKLARTRGLLCVCSIHQPPSSVFSLFDRLLLLTRQGRVAYSGPAQQVMQYMAAHAGHPCKDPWVNPAEFLLALASNTNHATVTALATSFAESPHAREVEAEVAAVYGLQNGANGNGYSPIRSKSKAARSPYADNEQKEPSVNEPLKAANGDDAEEMLVPVADQNDNEKQIGGQYYAVEDDNVAARAEEPRASFITQIRLVSTRAFVHLARNPGLLFLHLIFTILFGVGMGVIYLQLDNGIPGVLDRVGFLFFVIYFFALTSLSSLPHFTQDRVLFVRERADRYYSTLPYAISKVLCDLLPLRVLPPVIFACISYFMVGLQDDPYRFFVFVVLMVMVNVHAASVCFCISSFCTSLASANLLAAMWFIFWMLFGGFFVNMGGGSETISIVASLRYGSFFFYAFDALMLNEFMDLDVFWDAKNYPSIHIGGVTILENLSLENRSVGFNVGILMAMSFAWYFVGFVFLLLFQRTKR